MNPASGGDSQRRARAPAQSAAPLQALLSRIITRIMKHLTRAGYLVEEEGMSYPGEIDADRSHGIR
ncbi:MAG: hypothetical protein ACREXJ_09330 [Gammaproteobacteria bacterium]